MMIISIKAVRKSVIVANKKVISLENVPINQKDRSALLVAKKDIDQMNARNQSIRIGEIQ